MKSSVTILLSILIFGASFQNSLFMIDYKINQDFYEIHCVNKEKPEMECHGKCQMKKESEKSTNPFNLVKYAFEFNILPTAPAEFLLENRISMTINLQILLFRKFLFLKFSSIFCRSHHGYNLIFRNANSSFSFETEAV